MNLEDLVDFWFFLRWKIGHATDSEDTLPTCDWETIHKIWPTIQFFPWDFRTCPGHFNLRWPSGNYDSCEICFFSHFHHGLGHNDLSAVYHMLDSWRCLQEQILSSIFRISESISLYCIGCWSMGMMTQWSLIMSS